MLADELTRIRQAPDLNALYRHADPSGLTPGWVPRDVPILWREPTAKLRPAHWSFDATRGALDAAGRLIDVALAERRNLLMRNRKPGTTFATVNSLVCDYEEAEGRCSVVSGERVPTETGDIVLTPGWHWHAPGHDGDQPAIWLDMPDVPLVHLLEPMFSEDDPDGPDPIVRAVEQTPFRFRR